LRLLLFPVGDDSLERAFALCMRHVLASVAFALRRFERGRDVGRLAEEVGAVESAAAPRANARSERCAIPQHVK
jgi:hypothetical protein